MLMIIFGAGASYDHMPALQEIERIPLTNALINAQMNYAKTARANWPGVLTLLERLQSANQHSRYAFNLETTLYDEQLKENPDVTAQLIAFKFYVHEVLTGSEELVRSHNQGQTNYGKLLNQLQIARIDRERGVILVSFNYDTLIETACTATYPDWEFTSFEEYVEKKYIKLFKPHGSLNWKRIYKLRPNNNTGAVKRLHQLTPNEVVRMIERVEPTNPTYINQNTATGLNEPIIALPYREKTSFAFPASHRATLTSSMKEVDQILTIGWRGEEMHFFDSFLSKIPKEKTLSILTIDNGSGNAKRRLQDFFGPSQYVRHYTQGFSELLQDASHLQSFLQPSNT